MDRSRVFRSFLRMLFKVINPALVQLIDWIQLYAILSAALLLLLGFAPESHYSMSHNPWYSMTTIEHRQLPYQPTDIRVASPFCVRIYFTSSLAAHCSMAHVFHANNWIQTHVLRIKSSCVTICAISPPKGLTKHQGIQGMTMTRSLFPKMECFC